MEAGVDIGFNMIHKPTDKRVNFTKTAQGISPIDAKTSSRTTPSNANQYVTFTPEELDAVRLETKKTLDLSEFVDVSQICHRFSVGSTQIRYDFQYPALQVRRA